LILQTIKTAIMFKSIEMRIMFNIDSDLFNIILSTQSLIITVIETIYYR